MSEAEDRNNLLVSTDSHENTAHSSTNESAEAASSSQTSGIGNSSRRQKWERIGQQTYAEIASACPGGSGGNNTSIGFSNRTESYLPQGDTPQRQLSHEYHHSQEQFYQGYPPTGLLSPRYLYQGNPSQWHPTQVNPLQGQFSPIPSGFAQSYPTQTNIPARYLLYSQPHQGQQPSQWTNTQNYWSQGHPIQSPNRLQHQENVRQGHPQQGHIPQVKPTQGNLPCDRHQKQPFQENLSQENLPQGSQPGEYPPGQSQHVPGNVSQEHTPQGQSSQTSTHQDNQPPGEGVQRTIEDPATQHNQGVVTVPSTTRDPQSYDMNRTERREHVRQGHLCQNAPVQSQGHPIQSPNRLQHQENVRQGHPHIPLDRPTQGNLPCDRHQEQPFQENLSQGNLSQGNQPGECPPGQSQPVPGNGSQEHTPQGQSSQTSTHQDNQPQGEGVQRAIEDPATQHNQGFKAVPSTSRDSQSTQSHDMNGTERSSRRSHDPRASTQQFLLVTFHVYVDEEAEAVKVISDKQVAHGDLTVELERGSSGKGKYWRSREPLFLSADEKEIYRYRYVATFKEGIAKRFFSWITGSGDKSVKETTSRILTTEIDQYDLFHPPGGRQATKTRFAGHFFFVKMLYTSSELLGKTKETFMKCEGVAFGDPSYTTTDESRFFKWIDKKAKGHFSWHESAFICSLIGQLVARLGCRINLQAATVDKLLLSLKGCQRDSIPQTSLRSIKDVAAKLLRAGSFRGYLAFVAYFCHLFEIKDFIGTANTFSVKECEEDCHKLKSGVVESIRSLEDAGDAKKLAVQVIKKCPTVDFLWELHREMSICVPSVTRAVAEEFSEAFRQFIFSRTRAKKADLLQPAVWNRTPIALQERLADPFVEALQQQVAQETDWTAEKLANVKALALDRNVRSSKHFPNFISVLVQNHQESDIFKVMVNVLNSESFLRTWKAIPLEDRSNISLSLLKIQYHPQKKGSRGVNVVQLFEAMEIICDTRALHGDQEVCSIVEGRARALLQNVSLQTIVEAFDGVQTFSQNVQSCYTLILADAIKKEGGGATDIVSRKKLIAVLKPEEGTDALPTKLNGARRAIILSLLDVAEMPMGKEKERDMEEILKMMMQVEDVWSLVLGVLNPKSVLHGHRKVKLVVGALTCLRDALKDHSIRVNFMLDLKEEGVIMLAKFCSLIGAAEGASCEVSSEEKWRKHLLSEWNDARKFQKRFAKLEQSIQFVQKLLENLADVQDATPLIQEINKRKRDVFKRFLKEVLVDNYWGSLLPLIDSAETIHELLNSTLFFNVARAFVMHAIADSVKESSGTLSADGIMALLSNKGIEAFQQACNPLLNRDVDPAIDEVSVLLHGITNEEELRKELQLISDYFRRPQIRKDREKMLSNYLKYPLVKSKVQQLMSTLQVFGYDDTDGSGVDKVLEEFVLSCDLKDMTLSRLSKSLESKTVTEVHNSLDKDLTDILSAISESRELLKFMEETASEDIVVLIDAVEEHSDQFVSEATVSHLIDVHRFLSNVVRDKPTDPMECLHRLKDCYENLEQKSGMAAKIMVCSQHVHSLRGLYKNVANRGEMTKEIISNTLKRGCYQLGRRDDGSWEVLLTYPRQKDGDQETCYKLTDLQDLRSRALLIANTDKKHDDGEASGSVYTECSATDLTEFITQVELITEMLNMAAELHNSGHPEYKTFWVNLTSTQMIKDQANRLSLSLQRWKSILEAMQKKHFFLNFFHPDQLWIFNEFFARRPNSDEKEMSRTRQVHDLLRFIDPVLQLEDIGKLRLRYKKPDKKNDFGCNLGAIGEALDAFFLPRKPLNAPQAPQQFLQGAVQPGKLFVAVLEKGSTQTVHVVMSLFESTMGSSPGPSQVLFCHSETGWEEIERLLRRSFEAHGHSRDIKLHCLANVEKLPNDMQFDLVAAVKDFQTETDAPFLLSIVCCGGPHHHIADQFATSAHNVTGMTEAKLRNRFTETGQQVSVVTSDFPGLGKTEMIHNDAALKKKTVLTFPISGSLSRRNLVQRLSNLKVGQHECVHFDLGEVDDPLALDTFLFELIVVGMVSSGTQLYHLPTEHIYIEIANTLNNWLQDSLPVIKCFNPVHAKFDGYKHIVASQEPSSAIQVVCHYLHAYDSGTLESKDLVFNGANKLRPLPSSSCKALLSKYFSSAGEISYNIVETFVGVFADQLLRFSASPFLKPHNLTAMIGPSHDVRNRMFTALLEVSKEFAARSVVTCKAVQSEAITAQHATDVLQKAQFTSVNTADMMVERVESMIQWADNNHLLLIFHSQKALAISALYRELSLVPQSVQDLFKSQAVKGKGEGLEDYANMTQEQLQRKLELFAWTARTTETALSSVRYALTPDNILKMVLILLRIRATIPVIVMGETGCGKTSLVRYLAKTCDVPFYVFNFHAGITESQIITFVEEMEEVAKRDGKSVWVFLDEINTCDHLGTINEMMCHRSIKGRPLPPNLVFIAACNPYRLRPTGKITTSGLAEKATSDEYSKLVYRVHPLPETMTDYVWDYGCVRLEDERAYIGRMVEGIFNNRYRTLLVDLLISSQEYVRDVDKSSCCVSLRDVNRCIVLIEWFYRILKSRKDLSLHEIQSHVQKHHKLTHEVSRKVRSVVLALAHCYQSRLQTTKERDDYCMLMTSRFQGAHVPKFQADSFQAIVRLEQEEYLARMELPEGTARNAALRENVFVMLVCILNRIPVFVVGKPGCSKSLSMQVIRSNLRGKDSKDPFLKQLPQLYVVSYQGSESSTSEGISKVFEKARRYKAVGSNEVLPVVLLDEIGLAEVSTYNPLKILHSLLEPGNGEFPDVAVVGISNWCLDPAKMNRAIHLSRPEPDVADLFETGQSIREAQRKGNDPFLLATRVSSGYEHTANSYPDDNQLNCLANAYQEYQKRQRHENFHGLRDYYCLVKSLSSPSDQRDSQHLTDGEETKAIQRTLQRNFGGLPCEVNMIQQLFLEHFQTERVMEESQNFPVTDLIHDNLHDKFARHMMIITSGDSAIGVIDQTLKSLDKEKVVIFGSRFEEDRSEEYSYTILSRIILCMERDCVLLLRDLESIYGSLYDMLNQNYTVVGQKKNCRVALGPFSNPMCQVHDEFRCIVLIDEQRVDYTDPPFLNRFEKQLLRFSDVLNSKQKESVSCLRGWANAISTVQEHESHFDETDMFVGFTDETLPSLVLHVSENVTLSKHEIVDQCKQVLMWIASADGVLRSLKSNLSKTAMDEVQVLYSDYFEKPIHSGLKEYLRQAFEDPGTPSEKGDKKDRGLKLLVMTHSNIHTNVLQCLDGLGKSQTEKLSAFKSEKQLAKQLHGFWTSDANLLVLQCKPDLDAPHMLVAKYLIEQQRDKYVSPAAPAETKRLTKHVCIIVHVGRESKEKGAQSPRWQFSFQSGWRQVTIDVLETPVHPLPDLLGVGVTDLLGTESLSFERIASDQLLWCFTRIKYPSVQQPTLDAILHLVKLLQSSPQIMKCFRELVTRYLKQREEKDLHEPLQCLSWQVAVASDRQALLNFSTLVGAMQHHIYNQVRQPLAKIVYFLEKESAWPMEAFSSDPIDEEALHHWTELLLDERIFNINDIPDAQGAESYFSSDHRLQLQFPFASFFCAKVEKMRSLYLEDLRRLELDEGNFDDNGELVTSVFVSQLHRFGPEIQETIPHMFEIEYLQRNVDKYVNDLLDLKTADFSGDLSRDERATLLKSLMAEHIKVPTDGDLSLIITQLHSAFWLEESVTIPTFQLCVTCRDLFPAEIKSLTSRFVKMFDKVIFGQQDESFIKAKEKSAKGLQGSDEHKEQEERASTMDESDRHLADETEGLEAVNLGGEEQRANEEEEEEQDKERTTGANYMQVLVSFRELLVERLCTAFFPTQNVVQELQGPEGWLRAVNLFLSMVSRMQVSVPAFHFLRVCHDFVTLVLLSEKVIAKPFSLFMIGELGHAHASNGYLESPECFKQIDEHIDSLEANPDAANKILLKEFRVVFYGRCIDSNPDTPVLGPILIKISSSGDEALIKLAGPVVHRIFLCEDKFSPGVFEELLQNPTKINDHPGLEKTSYALSLQSGELELDSPFAVMCCDLISEVGFGDIDLTAISGSEDPVLVNLREAANTVSETTKEDDTSTFSLLCAVAYLRSFLASFANLVLQNRRIMATESGFSMLMKDVNAVFSSGEALSSGVRTSQMRLLFLRELRKELSIHTLKQITQESTKLPALQAFEWHTEEQNCVGKLSFDPFMRQTEMSEAKLAFASFIEEKDPEPLKAVLNTPSHSTQRKIELAAVLSTWIYLVRSTRNLGDIEEKIVDLINDEVRNFPKPYGALLSRVTGKKDFNAEELCISPESSPTDVHRAALILHFCIILASNCKGPENDNGSFMAYFAKPAAWKRRFVLASADCSHRPFQTYENCCWEASSKRSCFYSCPCGTTFALANEDNNFSCPYCRTPCRSETDKAGEVVLGVSHKSVKGYIMLPPSDDSSCCLRDLGPTEFRILHLFVHVAMYGGFALEMFDDSSVSNIMVNNKGDSFPKFCFQHITSDLAVLCRLFDCKEEEIISLLHRILEETASLLTAVGLCTTQDERLLWEDSFSKAVSPLLRRFNVKRKVTGFNSWEALSTSVGQIEEDDNLQFIDRNERIPRLFRVTRTKSLSSLRAYYMYAGEEQKALHPLLGLFLDFDARLPMVTHLKDLLLWSRMVDVQLSRRKSRKEARLVTIGDVIRGKHHSKEITDLDRECLREGFEKFKLSWEEIRPTVMKTLGKDMPHLTEMSSISFCLVERKEDGIFLCTALDALQEIQNAFIRKALAIAVTGKCAALGILEQGEGMAAVRMVHLQDAKEKEIIHYQWSNEILRHSQHNTEYGCGKEIFFDIRKIEKELAIRFLLGKSLLSTTGGLREFTFANELFHACRGILEELECIVPQQPLTKDVQAGLRSLKERSLKSVQDLLEHVEIVLCLLKKHQSGKPAEPLTEFTDRWLSDSRPFPKALLPKPHDAVQLKHIVPLYEFLEDMLADSATEGIHDMYREEIPSDTRDEMMKVIGDSGIAGTGQIPLESITTALRRFTFRYLSSEEMRPEPGLSLLEHMMEPSLWPVKIMKERKASGDEMWIQSVIPESLTLGHIHAVLSLYHSQLKIFEEKRQPPRSQPVRNRKSAPARSLTRRSLGGSFGFS